MKGTESNHPFVDVTVATLSTSLYIGMVQYSCMKAPLILLSRFSLPKLWTVVWCCEAVPSLMLHKKEPQQVRKTS
jgi:tryptophan-rich sensory protein